MPISIGEFAFIWHRIHGDKSRTQVCCTAPSVYRRTVDTLVGARVCLIVVAACNMRSAPAISNGRGKNGQYISHLQSACIGVLHTYINSTYTGIYVYICGCDYMWFMFNYFSQLLNIYALAFLEGNIIMHICLAFLCSALRQSWMFTLFNLI